MACVARAARGSFVTILQFLLIRNAAEELNKFHYNYVYLRLLSNKEAIISKLRNYCFLYFIPHP